MISLERSIALDANILIRASLGRNVRRLLDAHKHHLAFLTPQTCIREAQDNLLLILSSRMNEAEMVMAAFANIRKVVKPVDEETYLPWRNEAMRRISHRDPDDWPLVALSLAMQCPIWTEDSDFFGTGIPVWNTRTVEVYLDG